MMTLNGGSAGLDTEIQNNETFNSMPRLSMFKIKGLYPTFPKVNNPVTGVILPAFDSNLSPADTAYSTGVSPYRDMTVRDKSGRPAMTAWFVPLGFKPEGSKFTKGGIYKYFGKSKSTFISPTTIGMPDPIVDLAIWIRVQKKKYNDTTWMHLVERKEYNSQDPTATEIQALPSPQMAIMMNVISTGSNPHDDNKDKLENRILVVTDTTFTNLLDDLNAYTPAGMTSIDPAFPRYKLGDITNPNAALKFTTEKMSGNITWVHLNFGETKEDPMAGTIMFYGSQMQVTPEQLAGRYNLTDTDNVIHIPTYDDIVMQLLVEGLVPREVMLAAGINKKCRHFPSDEDVQAYIEDWNASNPVHKKEAAAAAQPSAYNTPVGFASPQLAATPQPAAPAQMPVAQTTPGMYAPMVNRQPAALVQPQPATYQQPVQPVQTIAPVPVQAPVAPQPAPTQQTVMPSMSQQFADSLSPEELAEMQQLELKAQTDPTSMTTEDFNKLAMLISRKQH